MKKNNYISLVLLFVFSFVLLHNVIPHHHHDENTEITNHEHEHHHDNKDQDHHNNENDNPIGSFSHPTHIVSCTEFIYSNYHISQKTQNVNQGVLTSNFILRQIIVSIKQDPPDYFSVIKLHHLYSTPSLRGPPVFSV